MDWYFIVVITLLVYWIIGMIWAMFDDESVVYWATGLVYPCLWFMLYPIRAYNTYKRSSTYFKKHNISCVQYIFGKRVKRED